MYMYVYNICTISHGIVQQHLFVCALAALFHLLDMSWTLFMKFLSLYMAVCLREDATLQLTRNRVNSSK